MPRPIITKEKRKRKKKRISQRVLPAVPNKRYFTIGEVAALCQVASHVLRYWEQEFSQLKPLKRRGNRRYYQPADVTLIREIRQLLYKEGYTIEGAKARLLQSKTTKQSHDTLKKIISELENLVLLAKVG